MIKTYIIKIQSRNLTHDHRLLAVQKSLLSNDPEKQSQKLSQFRLKTFEPEPGSGSFVEILGHCYQL